MLGRVAAARAGQAWRRSSRRWLRTPSGHARRLDRADRRRRSWPSLVGVLLSLAFLLLADRKVWAGVQMRKGPNVVGPFGLLQSFADFGKFVLKEIVIPDGADKIVFLLAPVLISFTLAFGAWAAIPLAPGWVVVQHQRRHPLPVRHLLARRLRHHHGRLGVELEIPVPGRLRSAAQMVSYEVSIGFVIVTVIMLAGSMNLQTIVEPSRRGGFWNWNVLGGGGLKGLPMALVMIPMAVVFFVSSLAETNRPPFDLPEAESELVAGYQVEYSLHALPAVHDRRIRQHRPDVRADQRCCSSAAGRRRSRPRS